MEGPEQGLDRRGGTLLSSDLGTGVDLNLKIVDGTVRMTPDLSRLLNKLTKNTQFNVEKSSEDVVEEYNTRL